MSEAAAATAAQRAAAPATAASQADGPLGVIAGRGALPRLLAEAARRQGGDAYIVALCGAAEPWVEDWPHVWCGFGQVGRIFSSLRAAGCRRVAFAGGVSRPALVTWRFDLQALGVAWRMARLLRAGDDGLLRGVGAIFEERGFELIAAHSILGDLLAPAGALGRVAPSARDLEDLARAQEIVAALGRVDVGQGAVVAHGRCLGLESVQGTDAMLGFIAGDPGRGGAPKRAGVLYKAPKPGQDLRFDLPAIGPITMEKAAAAGLNGVAMRAGQVFLLDPAATIAAADRLGLFLYGAEEAAAP